MQKEIGKNITATLEGTILTLRVDISQNFGLSKSGKSTIIASSEGNQKIGEVTVGLNVYTK